LLLIFLWRYSIGFQKFRFFNNNYLNNEIFKVVSNTESCLESFIADNSFYYLKNDSLIECVNLTNFNIATIVDLGKVGGICGNELIINDGKLYFSNCKNDVYEYNMESDIFSFVKQLKNKLLAVYKFRGDLYFNNQAIE